MDASELISDLLKLIFLGILAGFGARLAMPGDQHMGIVKTALYGIAGGIIGGGTVPLYDETVGLPNGDGSGASWLAWVFNGTDMLAGLAAVIVAVALIGYVHQGGVLIPEDADETNADKAPRHQGGDFLDRVTRRKDGDLEREAATDVAELEEQAVRDEVARRKNGHADE